MTKRIDETSPLPPCRKCGGIARRKQVDGLYIVCCDSCGLSTKGRNDLAKSEQAWYDMCAQDAAFDIVEDAPEPPIGIGALDEPEPPIAVADPAPEPPIGVDPDAPMPPILPYMGNEPVRAHPFDAGLDLVAAETAYIMPGEMKKVSTGTKVAIPEGCVGFLMSRSGFSTRTGLMLVNGSGVIDAGYQGDIAMPLVNVSQTAQEVREGERIAQLVIVPVALPVPVRVDSFAPSERGEGGFGSTGR